MKQQWEKFALRIDSLTLRERAMVFAASVAAILFIVYYTLLDPLYARQKMLITSISQQQNQIGGIDAEIAQKMQLFGLDPDASTRVRLARSKQELAASMASMQTFQRGLVAPEKIIPMLQQLLRSNEKVRILSLKTLPVRGISEAMDATPVGGAASAGAPANNTAATPAGAQGPAGTVPAAAVKPPELMYRHGVEIVVQGAYPDLVNYMAALEALPTQLFWGKARLDAGVYPNTTLTLTLYTLSLEQKWMTL